MAKEQTFEHPPRGHVALLAYDSDNDRFQVVHVNVDGELQVYLAGHAGTVLVQQYMPSLLQPGINTYDGSAWHKQPPIWSYSDRLAERKQHTLVAGTTYAMDTTAVPAGYVDRITGFSMACSRTGSTVQVNAVFGGVLYVVNPVQTLTANLYVPVSPFDLVLAAGDYVRFDWGGIQAGDVMIGNIWGYRMAIAM